MAYLIPFGKHAGKDITSPDVPTGWLQWAVENINPTEKPELHGEASKELARRRGGDGPATGHGKPPAAKPKPAAAPSADKPDDLAVQARMRDIVVVGADRLQACAYTNLALERLIAMLEESVPF